MKAKDFAKWVVNDSINTEGMHLATIDKEFDYEAQFGNPPLWDVDPGEYVAIYTDCISLSDINNLKRYYLEDGHYTIVPTDSKDNRNGGMTAILLIKLEE